MENKKTETPSTAIAVKEKPLTEMTPKELIQSRYLFDQVANALPSLFTPKQFMRVTLTAFNKNPKLSECTNASIASCILQIAQVGLLPDGRHAHLIPRNNKKKGIVECNYQLDYKGIVQLIYRSEKVSFLHADTVCEHDQFEYSMGEIRKHEVDFKRPRGKPYAAYALAKMKDGSIAVTVMGWDEIMAIADRSDSVKAAKMYGTQSVWDTDAGEMSKKTVIKRLSKLLPLSYEAQTAIEADNRADFTSITETIHPADRPASTASVNDKLKGKRKKETETVIEGDFTSDESEAAKPTKDNDDDHASDSDL
jgi:recombination protein RecT